MDNQQPEGSIIKFKNEKDEEELIERQNLVTVLPGPEGECHSQVIHVTSSGGTSIQEVCISKAVYSPLPSWDYEAHNIHVIVSTKSGTETAGKFYSQALEPVLKALFHKRDFSTNVHYTESANTIKELTTEVLWPKANNGEKLLVILLSGDGGVIDMVNAMLSKQPSVAYRAPKVAIFPMGTGNALAHSIGTTKDNTSGLSILARGKPLPLPIFKAIFSPGARMLVDEARREEELPKDSTGTPNLHGAVVCSWGMHATLVADSDTAEYRKFGVERFKMAAKEALYPADGSSPHPYKARVSVIRKGETEWQSIPRDEHMYVLATLVSNLEKTFVISPASQPLDGNLRLVHFGPTSGDEAMRIMGLAYQGGKHIDEPAVGYENIERLRIQFNDLEDDGRWRRICIDGTIVRLEKDGWVEVAVEKRHVLDVLSVANEL
ncbi:hypothetical protein GQ43DRAFT_100554 [Delitschia confertaspora ATCC 74209]|uniref:DAGKc domain-containing protein n=1 Tax=Delitschia confertaspora ATCC 74209 TaxID=1513339 RepID=A0A9P4JI47_9PLEO|nr:hypothetical protein GQ43DRAFT_100554 [Delitschia confertaspora ATCC 74209]